MDPDARVKQVKEEMSKWIEEASARRPCVLILDNLELLLGPENEVS
jgi:peroxin-1